MRTEETHDHDHHEPSGESPEVTAVNDGTISENTVVRDDYHSEHEHSGIDGLLEVMFGFEHVVAEIFWNTVWLGLAFAAGRLIAFRRVHKYIDDKHGVKHDRKEY